MPYNAMADIGDTASFSWPDILWVDTSFLQYLFRFDNTGRREYDYRAADTGANGYDGGEG